jgi:23S rRNA pseudouridine955/2504/2580 synthase
MEKSTFSPSFCFRLDKDTSGILIAGKNYESLKYLNKIIRDREVEKYYLTVVG